MKKGWKMHWRRWLLGAGIVATLSGSAAYAYASKECVSCRPCGSSSDGGYIICCDFDVC